MCGIAGIIAKDDAGRQWMTCLPAAANTLLQRGPDGQHFFSDPTVSFGHCRLSIIDLSAQADQPMKDITGRYCIIYNGEIFNYRLLRKQLEAAGVQFTTHSDTEVLLQLYIREGRQFLHQLNGFFAFAIYDAVEKSCFIARDRFGIKPLFYYEDEHCLLFASEMKALLQFPLKKELDQTSLQHYLQLNYIPGPGTIYDSIKKLMPGCSMFYHEANTSKKKYYTIPSLSIAVPSKNDYSGQQKALFSLLENAVQLRLISDVPLGGFLSGGLDSSIICGLAARHTQHLKTFSIGFEQDGFFDETVYANAVAKHFQTDHTVFKITRDQLHASLFEALDYLDEPFADSSALPVFLLSKLTRQHVKVALSGDGADELFGGYVKHSAAYRARHPGLAEFAVATAKPFLKWFHSSRNNADANRVRQLLRFAKGMALREKERYWYWCSIASQAEAKELLRQPVDQKVYDAEKAMLTQFIRAKGDLNDVLLNDVHLVLPNDMLVKVDSMSMANGLEVRVPFLDYRVVEFAIALPAAYKLNAHRRKMILHDAFRDFLPPELYHRPKRGFEIPLHGLLTCELRSVIEGSLFSKDFIADQGIFSFPAVKNLIHQLFSGNPGDSAARVWGLLVFQNWWKRQMG